MSFLNRCCKVKYEAKIVVSSCRKGEMNTIRTSHPMKLAFGSYRIIGMPKFLKSDAGSKSRMMVRPQMAHITKKVKNEVMKAYLKTRWRVSLMLRSRTLILFAMYQPTTNPNSMQKIGTPIPIPTHRRSRRMKSTRTILKFLLKILVKFNQSSFIMFLSAQKSGPSHPSIIRA